MDAKVQVNSRSQAAAIHPAFLRLTMTKSLTRKYQDCTEITTSLVGWLSRRLLSLSRFDHAVFTGQRYKLTDFITPSESGLAVKILYNPGFTNKSILSGALDNDQLKILSPSWISTRNYFTLQSHALVGIHNWIQHVIDYLPLPSHENAANFEEIVSEARERKMNAIRRQKQIINPSLCTGSTALILVTERKIGMPRENRRLDLRDG